MPHVESPVAPVSLRIGLFGNDAAGKRARTDAPKDRHGGAWENVRGNLLYPALLTTISFLSRLVTRDKDGLR